MKKRIFDIGAASVMGILASPLIAGTAAMSWLVLGRPVLFREERIGQHGKPFTMYKFRTMTDKRDENGHLLSDNERTPALLRYIRKSGLDELPQLFNIIRGDMSVVGPRPHGAVEFKDCPPIEKQIICSVKPGLTGPTQVRQIHGTVDHDAALREDFAFAGKRASVRRDVAIIAQSTESLLRGHEPLTATQKTNEGPVPPR